MATYVDGNLGDLIASATAVTPAGYMSCQVGDVILVFTSHEDALKTCTVTDSESNSYSLVTGRDIQHGTEAFSAYLHWATAGTTVTNGLQVTSTMSSTSAWLGNRVAIFRPANYATAPFYIDTSIEAQGSGTAQATGTFNPAGVGGAAAAFFAEFSGGTGTPGSGWTELGPTDNRPWGMYRLLTNETSINGDMTWTAADAWLAIGVALREGAASEFKPRRTLLGVG